MRTITAADGGVETVSVRRTESADAPQINSLISPATVSVFGRVNVIHLLEKANLAVSLTNSTGEVLAHAAFLDYPLGDIVDQASWEPLMRDDFKAEKCTPLNTLFLHVFVAQPVYSAGSAPEIMRTVFDAITELEYIYLVTPNDARPEPALLEIFEPMEKVSKSKVQCSAFVCQRYNYCPRLYVRRARIEDHDDLTHVCSEETRALTGSYGPFFLAELIEAQDAENHAAVCESDGVAVGFISMSGNINLKLLNECFELGPFNGLYKPRSEGQPRPAVEDPPEAEEGSQNVGESNPGCLLEHTEKESAGREDVTDVPCDTSELQISGDGREPGQCPEMPNAFRVQLFFIDKKFEMRSTDFLPNIFQLFPDRDFCVITVPKLAPEFPFLQSFLRVVPRPTSSLAQELYIFHRSGLLKTIEVRVAVSADRPFICALVENLHLHESLLNDLDVFCQARRDPDGTPLQAFVAQVQDQVVGVIISRNEEDIDYIRANYNIEDFIYFSHHRYEEHAQLCHFALSPVFQHYAKHFLKEALRLAHKSCLYYPIHPVGCSEKNSCAHYLTSVLGSMVPVRPRRQIVYPLEELGINAPSKQITREQGPYALNHINRKLTMEPKVTVNARIVVVGASNTALAFLEVLAFCPHLRFNNLTLISTHGYPGYYMGEHMRFLSTSHGYSERDHAQLSLRSWINVVTGKMTAIDRAANHVLLSGGGKVPYDHLLLCTGQQYQVPCPIGGDINQPPTNSELSVPPGCRYVGKVPSNLFSLNDPHDCAKAFGWLQKNLPDLKGNVVVYGNSLDAYTCVEAVLSMRIPGSCVHLVRPPSQGSCFDSPAVEEAVGKALERSEVHVHHGCLLAQLNGGQDPEPLTSVSFITAGDPLLLQCSVFLNVSSKGVDYDAFKAINDACLVYDGRLVIDSTFHTNDASIRAAGPLTKFARRYHADRWSHSNFSSREVGQELAAALLPLFDPTLEPAPAPPADLDRLTPLYQQAKVQGGTLPGRYNYLHVTKPPLQHPATGQLGREILTGRTETGNYFLLRLNQYDVVETITCLSQKPIPVSNLLCLYGKHQLLLNRLCSRYDDGLVHDLYRESWCLAIYHDRFPDFEQEMRQIMESTEVKGNNPESIPDFIQRLMSESLEDSEDPMLIVRKVFSESGGLATLKTSTLNFLRYNRNHLTMYAQPGCL